LDGFVVKNSTEPPVIETPSADVPLEPLDQNLSNFEEVIVWDEEKKVDEAKEEPPTNNNTLESKQISEPSRIDTEAQNTKRKEAITRLVALRRYESKQKLIKVTLASASILIISGIVLGVYYQHTIDEALKIIATPETFEQYVEHIVSLETPIENSTDDLDSENSVTPNSLLDAVDGTNVNVDEISNLSSAKEFNVNKADISNIDKVESSSISDVRSLPDLGNVFQATLEGEVGDRDLVIQSLPQLRDAKIDANIATSLVDNLNATAPLLDKETVTTQQIIPSEISIEKMILNESPRYEESSTVLASSETQSRPIKELSTNYVRLGKRQVNQTTLLIKKAYIAYQNGQLDAARKLYEKILFQAPEKRDAILGAAAVAMRQSRQQDALVYYQQLLSVSPQDSFALAGILSLQVSNIQDPSWLSQVNQLLITYPEGAHLHFLKANAHMVNGRWQAAQQSYFDAWSRDKTNPDYAYNLAIALDQLGQASSALKYYVKAKELSRLHPSNIVIQDLDLRITQLRGGNSGS